jgi:hypothetical protein
VAELTDLADRWSGQTAYVVGSSAALDYFDPRYFDDANVIAINYVAARFGLHDETISVSQYHRCSTSLRDMGWSGLVVQPDRPLANQDPERHEPDERTIHVEFPNKVDYEPFLSWERTRPELVQGGTSLHPALHLAAYMGASTIITVAADHGWWDGRRNAQVYEAHTGPGTDILIPKWHTETMIVARRLREWGVRVHTLLPFVNINCEDVSFKGPRANIG